MAGTDHKQEKILVIKLGALGDFIQALGPMAAIRKHHPDADITLLTTKAFVSLGQRCGYFDHIWDHKRPKWKDWGLWRKLRQDLNRGGFTRVYDLQNNDRTALYLKLFRAKNKPEWVGAAKGASHRNNSPERTAGNALAGHIQTLKLAGIKDITIDKMDWIDENSRFIAPSEPYVLLVPGCAPEHDYKRWPATHYGHMARHMHGWGYRPVLIGTAEEKELAKTICGIFPATLDLTGQTTLFDIVVLARHAAACIGNDTGPMHLIAPTGCPSWILFSARTNPQRHAPQGATVNIIQRDCLDDLTVQDVLSRMKARDFRQQNNKLENR